MAGTCFSRNVARAKTTFGRWKYSCAHGDSTYGVLISRIFESEKGKTMKEIGKVELGEIGLLGVKIEEGKLKLDLGLKIDKAGVETTLAVSVDAGVVLDVIKNAIPGKVDDAIIDVMKAALQAL